MNNKWKDDLIKGWTIGNKYTKIGLHKLCTITTTTDLDHAV